MMMLGFKEAGEDLSEIDKLFKNNTVMVVNSNGVVDSKESLKLIKSFST
jgi:hypothetical protein